MENLSKSQRAACRIQLNTNMYVWHHDEVQVDSLKLITVRFHNEKNPSAHIIT